MGREYKTTYFLGISGLGEVDALHIETLVSGTNLFTFLYQYYEMGFSIALNYTNCYIKHNLSVLE